MEWRKVNPKGVCGGGGGGGKGRLGQILSFFNAKRKQENKKEAQERSRCPAAGPPRPEDRGPTWWAPLPNAAGGGGPALPRPGRASGLRNLRAPQRWEAGGGMGGGGCEGSGAAWAGQRFTSAGLSSPLVLSLSFFGTRDVREADPSKKCHFNDFNKQNRKQF